MTIQQFLGKGTPAEMIKSWLPDNWFLDEVEILYRLDVRWDKFFGMTDENIASIYEFLSELSNKHNLTGFAEEDRGFEPDAYAHRWHFSDEGGNLSFTLQLASTMCEAFAEVMYDTVMQISQPVGFKVEYRKVAETT